MENNQPKQFDPQLQCLLKESILLDCTQATQNIIKITKPEKKPVDNVITTPAPIIAPTAPTATIESIAPAPLPLPVIRTGGGNIILIYLALILLLVWSLFTLSRKD